MAASYTPSSRILESDSEQEHHTPRGMGKATPKSTNSTGDAGWPSRTQAAHVRRGRSSTMAAEAMSTSYLSSVGSSSSLSSGSFTFSPSWPPPHDDTSSGYFSFRSVGLSEPEEILQDEATDVQKPLRPRIGPSDGKHRVKRANQGRLTHSGKHVERRTNRGRSQSLSRIFTLLSPQREESSGHVPPLPTPIAESARPCTPILGQRPRRPKLLQAMRSKSDPFIELHSLQYVSPYTLLSEKRCNEGFLVNAESSLRDVL